MENEQQQEAARVRYYEPDVDAYETETEVVFLADLPGATSEGLNINFEKGRLTIDATVPERQKAEGSCLVCEYGVGSYFRSFELNESVDVDNAKASFVDGVLTLRIPKRRPQAKKITVQ